MSTHELSLDDFLEHHAEDTIIGDMTVEEYFEHYGVKGMKWGVRKETRGQGLTSWMIKDGASKAEMNGLKRAIARVDGAARVGVQTTNQKYKGVNLRTDAKARKKYNAEINEVFKRQYPKGLEMFAVYSVAGSAVAVAPAIGLPVSVGIIIARSRQFKNERAAVLAQSATTSPEDEFTITFDFRLDANGLIVDVVPRDPDILEHSLEMTSGEFLAHWGVKGMKWGVRKDRTGVGASSASASEDHINVAALRKKKVSQLSNAEIKAVTERMNLEKKYREMNPSDHELLMRKLRKHTDTATKVVMWMASPTGKALLKSMGLDEKSRKANEKAKQQARAKERQAKKDARAKKKKAKEDLKPKLKKEYMTPKGVVYR